MWFLRDCYMNIRSWLSSAFISALQREHVSHTFKENKPFPHIFIKDFLEEEKARQLSAALCAEKFEKKQSDLFSLSQTQDFGGIKRGVLQDFYQLFCSKKFAQVMQQITGIKLKVGTIDMAGSLYECCDYLLCHDDQLEGRKLAYIHYISDTFRENDGGSLALLADTSGKPGKTMRRYIPQWNSFIVFLVSPKSWHEVEEVLTEKKRYAIGG